MLTNDVVSFEQLGPDYFVTFVRGFRTCSHKTDFIDWDQKLLTLLLPKSRRQNLRLQIFEKI